MKVYIAAPYPMRATAIELMTKLEALGVTVTSSWLRAEDEMNDKYARLDLADVRRADALVAMNPAAWHNTGTGGRHVELGYALALKRPVVLLGDPSNIFHHLDDIRRLPQHVDVADLLSALVEVVSNGPARKPVSVAIEDVLAEFSRAEAKHKPFNSAHEGYAVIQEEVDELWDDVKADRHEPALKEAVQVAAMGLRYVVNLTPRAVPPAPAATEKQA